MNSLSKYVVLGLILFNSNSAFSEDAPAVSVPVPEMVEPPNAPPMVETGHDPSKIKNAAEEVRVTESAQEADVMSHVSKEYAELEKNVKGYVDNSQTCKERENRANTICMESRNPDYKKYIIMTQVLMAGVSGMMDACSKVGKLMDLGNKLLTGYQAACSSIRGHCMSACGTAKRSVEQGRKNTKALLEKASAYADQKSAEASSRNDVATASAYQQAKASIKKNTDVLISVFDKELEITGDHLSVAEKAKTCEGYAKELASAGVGLLGMAMTYSKANNCEENTSNTAVATPTPVDCSVPENKQNNMTCICQDAPRTPGCSTGLDSTVAAKNAESMRAASTSDYVPMKAGGNNGLGLEGNSGGMDLSSNSPDSSSSAPGAPMGGGGAGLDGGSGGGSTANKAAAQKAAGLNANILAGEGGGGGWGGSGGYGADSGLRQYLPGGAKDPAIGLAGQAGNTKEVTSQGGKSNWEKVRDRYRDNKPRLLGP